MTATSIWWIRRRAAARTAATALLAVLAGCSVPAGPGVAGAGSPSAGPSAAGGVTVVLRFGDHAAHATLTDTPPARQFAAMLPLTVRLNDVWGQAKSGRLPHPLSIEGAVPVHDPAPGEIYFWPSTEVLAIYYDDLGQAVPDPGLIRLGVLDTGMDEIGHAGRQVTIQIDRETRS